MLDVILTVDSELSPDNLGRGVSLRDEMDLSFYGRTSGGEFGVVYQMDILNSYGLKGIFFVEALCASSVGLGPLREMVSVIQERGHDVQLHLHSEWLPLTSPRLLPGRSGLNMHCFSEDEQSTLIGRGLDNLNASGAKAISAFRAGNMGADRATLRALARNGILYDSSYFAPYLNSHCRLGSLGNINQPVSCDGVVEIPVCAFQDYPGHVRPMQLCACSSSELEHGLLQAWRTGWQTAVLLWHSFELIKRPGPKRRKPVPAPLVRGRFLRMCQFLSANRDKFQTVSLSHCHIKPAVAPQLRAGLHSPVWRTAWRVAEQAVGTFH